VALIKYITDVQFDFGAVRLLAGECAKAGIARPLVVTDKGVVAAGVAAQALAAIEGRLPLRVFDQTPGNPTEDAVEAALAVYRDHGADGIVAVGGGSAIDLAKALAILATHPGPLAPYCTIDGGAGRITAACAPLIAIPTTSGTGSEVARGAIIVLRDGRKVGFHSWHLVARCAICDPELTLGLPAGLSAATGMDAVAHCIETVERAIRWIRVAVGDGRNREARRQMMSASMQGAMAFQKGLGAVHSLSHALGSYRGAALHHGTLNAVVLPAVLRFNASAASVVADGKYDRLRRAMGLGVGDRLDEFAARLNRDLGLPSGLAAMGVPEAFVDESIDKAMKDHCHATNPRIATPQDYRQMLRESW
jgi:4-hydroxybutyrate dehydrogenase